MRTVAQYIHHLEPLVLLVVVAIFWLGDASRVWSLLLLLPLLPIRWLAHRHLVTSTPLNAVFALLIVLGLANILTAPFERGNTLITAQPLGLQAVIPWAWVMLGRPLMGIALYFVFVDHARHYGTRPLIFYTVGLGLIVALVSLLMTQWNSKSDQLRFLIDLFPQVHDSWIAPGGFNANEIAGGIAWLVPLMAALALHRWKPRILQYGAAVAFGLLLLSLFMGQSRLAIGGVVVGLAFVILFLIPRGHRMVLAFAALGLFVAAEYLVVSNILAPPSRAVVMQDRDENSTAGRLEMYMSVVNILDDHPLTGVGMNMYRDGQVRDLYPVPSFGSGRILPHAHNEFLQLGADFGYPGLVWFILLHGMALYMAWRCFRQPLRQPRLIAVGTIAALLAHGIYGTGDAVALWDRFIFVFWWVLALLGAQYTLVRLQAGEQKAPLPAQVQTGAQAVVTPTTR